MYFVLSNPAEHPHQRAGGQRAQYYATFAAAGEGTRINGPLTKKLRTEMGHSMHRPEGAHRQDWVLPPHPCAHESAKLKSFTKPYAPKST